MFAGGFTTFSLLYFVQSLLPVFAGSFAVSPATSSLALSGTTGVLAVALPLSGIVSDRIGRKRIMVVSLLASALLTLVMALAPTWPALLATRVLMGVTLSGVQAVAMAYLAEEIEPRAFGMSLGLFISGSAIGGMAGRLTVAAFADLAGWRAATAVMGALALAASLVFWRILPTSRQFRRSTADLASLRAGVTAIMRDRVFLLLFLTGFLLMGGFVSAFNYITFRLLEPPFALSQAAVGSVFLVYVTGIFGSTWIGDMASRKGKAAVLWVLLVVMLVGLLATLPPVLPLVVAGLALAAFGFFSGHSVASGWVAQRAATNRALAASLYLFAYYQGSSVIGTLGGFFWEGAGWPGVVGLTGGLVVANLVIALTLRRLAAGD